MSAAKKQTKTDGPDFAFPQTVDKKATAMFEKAMASKDGEKAIMAAVQMDIARSLVSSDSFSESVARFDSIAGEIGSPWKNLAYLLEARMYSEFYNENPFRFDRRVADSSAVAGNVKEWDGPMFKNKIQQLVERAFVNSEELQKIPLSKIQGLLINYQDAVKADFSVLDFITIEANRLLHDLSNNSVSPIIPFGDKKIATSAGSSSDFLTRKLEDALALHKSKGDMFGASFFQLMLIADSRSETSFGLLKDCYLQYKDTPYAAAFLLGYLEGLDKYDKGGRNENEIRREKYNLLKSYIERFPDAEYISHVESALDQLTSKKIEIEFPSRQLPQKSFSLKLNISNIYDFNLLVISLPESLKENSDVKDIRKYGKIVKTIPVSHKGSTPDIFNKEIEIDGLPQGFYTFVVSSDNGLTGLMASNEKYSFDTMTVSSINAFTDENSKDGNKKLYIVSASDNCPMENVEVKLQKNDYSSKKSEPVSLKTDNDGKISVPSGNYMYDASYKGGKIWGNIYSYARNVNAPVKDLRGAIITDLGIYKPGQKLSFSAILYNVIGKTMSAAPEENIRIELVDANYQVVDSCSLTTDKYGRTNGEFTIPENGLLGYWHLNINKNRNYVASYNIQVAEYKSPNFFVSMQSSAGSFKAGDILNFNGQALTYSGMPVAGGEVSYSLEYVPFWWSSVGSGAKYEGKALTGADGKFTIDLPTDNLRDTPYARGTYLLKVRVTDGAGETQEAPSLRFSLGTAYTISVNIPSKIKVTGKDCDFSVSVNDAIGHPEIKSVYYQLWQNDVKIGEGQFESPKFEFNPDSLRSGRYEFKFALNPEFKDDDEAQVTTTEVVIWRETDKKPAVESIIWVDEETVTASKNAKKIKIRVGSSYPQSHVLMQISDYDKVIESRWLVINDGFLTVEADAPRQDGPVFINFIGQHDFNIDSKTVRINPYELGIPLVIGVETFRDKISPGDKEQWKFKISYDQKPMPSLPVMAVMTNKALNAITPFRWNFNPSSGIYWNSVIHFGYYNTPGVSNYINISVPRKYKEEHYFVSPDWQTYGYPLVYNHLIFDYSAEVGSVKMSRSYSAKKAMAAPTSGANVMMKADYGAFDNDLLEHSMSMTEESVADIASGEGEAMPSDSNVDNVVLRQTEYPLAFFMPDLFTDKDGMVNVSFKAPEFVGTWQFQILSYTDAMKGSVLQLDAISSKKVMVEMNAPRFVRTGDRLSVSATLFNNSDEDQSVTGKIEFLNPITDELLYSYSPSAVKIAPSSSSVITADMKIPSDLDALCIRVYGLIPGYSDGEQTVIPVLPSSTPVIESTTFYLRPNEESFDIKLPNFTKDAKVTLTYCDNPVWECVTALPDILQPESSASMLAQARAFYGNCLASGLLKKYPDIAEGLKLMAQRNDSDSTLISPLEKNKDLKTVLLNNTPWVNDANSESMRMQGLMEYADPTKAKDAIDNILKVILNRQLPDGGWSWCPDMQSSTFITGYVYMVMALLNNMGYLPPEAQASASKAAGYLENEFADAWIKSKKKSYPAASVLEYLYLRSSFKNAKPNSKFAELEKIAIKDAVSNWKSMDIYQKAIAAIILSRRGDVKTSRLILESLRQFASTSPQKGMWFDNLNSQWGAGMPLGITATVLQAYAEIEPENTAIDQMRQWLVLSKQTEDWGKNRYLAEVINAILTTGTEWTASSKSPVIEIDGKEIETGKITSLTGSLTIDLTPASASGASLSIKRDAKSPAWGGVISQFVAPITSVKAASVPQLSITKQIIAVPSAEGKKTKAKKNLEVGEKVRVTLTLTCDRDIDYVAVTDPRPACLEPADQLSSYTLSDGVWMYREVRNEATNLFIPFLSKGTYVISYECYVDREGEYTSGVANAQSQYAPVITAHSAGTVIKVTE